MRYRAASDQQQAKERSIKTRKPRPLIEGSVLWTSVETLLRELKIAGILEQMYPEEKTHQVSQATIIPQLMPCLGASHGKI